MHKHYESSQRCSVCTSAAGERGEREQTTQCAIYVLSAIYALQVKTRYSTYKISDLTGKLGSENRNLFRGSGEQYSVRGVG